MFTTLKIAGFLSWINMIVWGFIAGICVLAALVTQNFSLLIVVFLLSVVLLHSYAAFQLHKSIRDPNTPLSSQTPVGIRFIGFIALFFGVLYIGDGVAILQSMKQVIDALKPQLPPQYKDLNMVSYMKGISIFCILTGLSISLNVILNFRLLRWYLYLRNREPK